EGLPYGPGRAADEFGGLFDTKGLAELRSWRAEGRRERPQKRPVVRRIRPRVPRPKPRPAMGQGGGRKGAETRGVARLGHPGLRFGKVTSFDFGIRKVSGHGRLAGNG